jgi:endonuclease/exonuclease/phosphatase family metal-dependent hydrolase
MALVLTPVAAAALTLNVMVFNVEYGGTGVDFAKVVEAVRVSGADVVGVEEGEGQIGRLAAALGWPYANARLQIVSKLPIVDPPEGDGVYVFVETSPGRVVAMANAHLPSDPYGPEVVGKGASAEEVLALESRLRLPPIVAQLGVLRDLSRDGIPVFLTGDFNVPSHRDWTAAMVGRRPQIRIPLRWPETEAVEAAGFRDSYREVHPDPVTHPGLTWWAGRPQLPGWNPGPLDPEDRIDFVFAAGPAVAKASRIVGESGRDGVDVGVAPPWPSDHRGVVSTFEVTPAPAPVLVSVEPRLVAVGDTFAVRFHAPGRRGESVAIQPAAVAAQSTGPQAPADGTLLFASGDMRPGAYTAALQDADGAVLASFPFWVRGREAKPEITLSQSRLTPGEPIVVTWRGAPGNRWDWVGVYKMSASPERESSLLWRHLGTAIEGTATFDATAEGGGWPLPPGDYKVYLLEDDSDRALASAPFTVAGVTGGRQGAW